MTEQDKWMEGVVSSLSEKVPVDPRARQRLQQAIHSAPAPAAWPIKLTRWLIRGYQVRVSPLAVLIGATCFIAILFGIERQSPQIVEVDQRAPAALLPIVEGPHQVRFAIHATTATRVAVVGDFNDWDLLATPLHRTGSGGLWSAVISLEPGRHLYSYVINGQIWEGTDRALQAPENEFGRRNSVVLVGENGPW